jgi:hypothetical protein
MLACPRCLEPVSRERRVALGRAYEYDCTCGERLAWATRRSGTRRMLRRPSVLAALAFLAALGGLGVIDTLLLLLAPSPYGGEQAVRVATASLYLATAAAAIVYLVAWVRVTRRRGWPRKREPP